MKNNFEFGVFIEKILIIFFKRKRPIGRWLPIVQLDLGPNISLLQFLLIFFIIVRVIGGLVRFRNWAGPLAGHPRRPSLGSVSQDPMAHRADLN